MADDGKAKLIGAKLALYTLDRSPIYIMLDADTACRVMKTVQGCVKRKLQETDTHKKKRMGQHEDIRCYELVRQGMDFDEAANTMGISPEMAKAAYMRVLSGRYGSEVRV